VTKRQRPNERRSRRLPWTHSEDGVDLTLIRWMLSLTPEERIRALEDHIYALAGVRNGTMHLASLNHREAP
jgi:hypothetical protein